MGLATERLYYQDSYLRDFTAQVLDRADGGLRLYLDRTAFYPASGGQPADRGTLNGVAVLDVIDEEDRIAHVLSAPLETGSVEGRIDWQRRFDHMQQHTGQHLLSAVLNDLYGLETVGFHLGADSSAIDVSAASLDAARLLAVESRVNDLVFENRPVSISFQEAGDDPALRNRFGLEGTLRIVAIQDYDRNPCGGTHVRATGEIGPVLLGKLDKAHGNVRIEFLCGSRAVRRARADYDALSQLSRQLSASPAELPEQVRAQAEALQAIEKTRRRQAAELARYRGAELYQSTAPDDQGLRRAVHRQPKGAIDDELRALAQSFTSGSRAVFVALLEEPPAVLLAVSKDSGLHAGEMLKSVLNRTGGRGGGNAQLAQGGLPSRDALREAAGLIGIH